MYISNILNSDPAVNNRRSSVGAPTVHNEVVLVVFDPGVIDFEALSGVFWEAHDPTQGMRQGNDSGTQYRSGIYTFSDEQQTQAEVSRGAYQRLRRDQYRNQACGPVLLRRGLPSAVPSEEPRRLLRPRRHRCRLSREPVQTRLNTGCIRRSRLR